MDSEKNLSTKKPYGIWKKIILAVFFIFSIFNLIFIFKPYVAKKLYIYHEFSQIPLTTSTYLGQLDNINYIEQNHLYGYRKIYDIRNPQKNLDGINCTRVSNIKIKDELNSIIDKEQTHLRARTPQYAVKSFIVNYFYLENNKVCSIAKMSLNDIKKFKSKINPVFHNDFDKIIMNNEKIPNIDYNTPSNFLESNRQNIYQDLLGFWAHHHNHILSAVSKSNLGVNPSQTFMQYGYGTTIFFKTILNHFHGFNFGDYYRILNSFNFIYYFALLAVLFIIFKNPAVALSAWGLILIILNKFPYIYWYMAPGANPIRHFFDIFVIAFIYLYFKNQKKINLFLVDLFCIAGIFIYPMYGIFLSLACIVTLFFRQIAKKSKFELVNAIILLIASLFAYKAFSIGLDLNSDTYINGLNGFLATKKVLFLIYSIIMVTYALIIKNIKTNNINKDLLLMLILYIQGLLLYYITISEVIHFLVLTPIYIITLFVFILLFNDTFNVNNKKNKVTALFFCTAIYAILIFISFPLHFSETAYLTKEFSFHPIYQWEIPHANFNSAMDPKYFVDSINLLQKKSYSQNNKIYMISEYDNFLPLLAKKYNAFPYIDLQWYLVDPKAYNKVKTQLLKEKPKYIFVDKFLTTDKLETVVFMPRIKERKWYFKSSLMKYQRLTTLKNLFYEVKKDYKPVASSYLLTVYERKNVK